MDLNSTELRVQDNMQRYAASIVHIYIIFLSYVVEEIFFDLVFKCVDIVSGFQVKWETAPYVWSMVR